MYRETACRPEADHAQGVGRAGASPSFLRATREHGLERQAPTHPTGACAGGSADFHRSDGHRICPERAHIDGHLAERLGRIDEQERVAFPAGLRILVNREHGAGLMVDPLDRDEGVRTQVRGQLVAARRPAPGDAQRDDLAPFGAQPSYALGDSGMLDLAREDPTAAPSEPTESEVAGLGASPRQHHVRRLGSDRGRDILASRLEQLPRGASGSVRAGRIGPCGRGRFMHGLADRIGRRCGRMVVEIDHACVSGRSGTRPTRSSTSVPESCRCATSPAGGLDISIPPPRASVTLRANANPKPTPP